ncbi:hypothetical protein TNCV_1505511 [Trichonephila clavipes]|nr:hypothetical protein TNCV_1505511 [Trichonephila clavipes]
MPSCPSVHDLELAVQDLWAHLPQDNIRCLINSMPDRLQNSTCQSSTSTGHQVFFINRYYNQSQINLPLQTGTSTILQSQINPPALNHKYVGHGNIMTMSSAHSPQTLTNCDKVATQQNEHSLREMSKNRIPQNVTNRNFANKHQYLLPEVSQLNMGHNKSSIKNMKSELPNMQNSLLHLAISKTLQLKQLPILSPELKKLVEMNQLSQLKRIPPGFQNNWKSSITQKLRKEAASVLLSKHNLLNYTQGVRVQKLKQNIYNAEIEAAILDSIQTTANAARRDLIAPSSACRNYPDIKLVPDSVTVGFFLEFQQLLCL